MKIILYQPQIPQNAGNIVRTCACTGASLVMVEPLGFETNNKLLKRAGLDYWLGTDVSFIDDLESYLQDCKYPFFFFSSRAIRPYTEANYTNDSLLIFGSETAGLPNEFHQRWPEHFFTIPMISNVRCLNLSNAAAVVIYEALRQQHFSFES